MKKKSYPANPHFTPKILPILVTRVLIHETLIFTNTQVDIFKHFNIFLTMSDIQAPIFDVCPSNIVAFTERRSNQTNVKWDIQASDNGNDPRLTCDLSPGVMTSGSYYVTCTAIDNAGNQAVCRFDIDVIGTNSCRLVSYIILSSGYV